jgi:prepilin peptidase CpaA
MSVPLLVIGILYAAALYLDIRHRTIPNRLTLPVFLSALCYHGICCGGTQGLWFSVQGAAVGGLLLFLPFAMGGMGGGDVKLLMATGAWLGAWATLNVFLYGAIAGALIAVCIMAVKRTWHPLRGVYHDVLALLLTGQAGKPRPAAATYPYSIALAVGVVGYLRWGTVI